MPLRMFDNKHFCFLPTKGLEFLDALNKSKRVFYCNGTVYKLYDTLNTPLKPNNNIIELLDDGDQKYLSDLCVTSLTTGGHKMLQYRYIKETNVSPTLEKLHKNGIVHSDVRARNLVFTVGGVIKLIDFDLAGKVGEKYPDIYNDLPDQRHPDARANKPRQPFHDIYALIKIMLLFSLTHQQKAYLRRCLNDESVCVHDIINVM